MTAGVLQVHNWAEMAIHQVQILGILYTFNSSIYRRYFLFSYILTEVLCTYTQNRHYPMRLRRTINNFFILHHCVPWNRLLNQSGSQSNQWKVRPMTYVNLQWRKKAEVRNAQPYAPDCVRRLERKPDTRLLSEENKVVVMWKQQTELPNKRVLIHGLILKDNSEKSPAPRIILGYSFDVRVHYHVHVIMTTVAIFFIFLFYLNCSDSQKQQKKEVVMVVSTFYLSF